MRPSRCSALLLLGVACGSPRALVAQSVEGGTFLLLPVGARATALGQAAVADGGTTEALFWNPAGLAHLRRSELALHHYTFFLGNGDAAAFALPSPRFGTFAVAAYLVYYGDFDVTPLGGGTIGRASASNVALAAGYATGIAGSLSAGIAYKLAQFRVDCTGDCTTVPTEVGTTHAVDVGLQWASALGAPLVLGIALRNAGFKLQIRNNDQADPLPTRLQLGAAYTVLVGSPDRERVLVRVLADIQGVVGHGALEPVTLVGLETGVRELLRIRAGYAFLDSQARGPSLGLGLATRSLVIDFARVFYAEEPLGDTEPFHISLRWMF